MTHPIRYLGWLIFISLVIVRTLSRPTAVSSQSFPSPAASVSPDSSPTTGFVTSVPTVSLSQTTGQILKIEGDVLVVDTSQGPQNLTIPSDIKITRNTFDTSLSQLKPGDRVTVTRTDEGDILSVEAVAGSTLNLAKTLIPLLIAGLILAGVVIYLINRFKKGTVKTQPPV